MIGVYIHLPFCKSKCQYCDFASFAGREKLIDDYIRALDAELAARPVPCADTLYIGGGTPSLLSVRQLDALLGLVQKQLGSIALLHESTFEANPESLTKEKIETLRRYGVSRVSLGLQSFNDTELKRLGRVHDAATFLKTYELLQQAGFTKINVDLIAGLPDQKLEDFLDSLDRLTRLRPNHISVYGLQIEEGTAFYQQGIVCDQLLMRSMLEQTHERLAAVGYTHYEISNYALPGYESLHNINYWNNGAYMGYGSAAASYWEGERFQNEPELSAYLAKVGRGESPVLFQEQLEGKAKAGERLLLGLRKLDGIDITEADERMFGLDVTNLINRGLLTRENNTIKLSGEGLYLANEVFECFVEPFE